MRIHPEVAAFATHITALGFIVYIAKSGQYGFITDDTAARVLSFSFTDSGSLIGNYGPPSLESGTGWRMDESPRDLKTREQVREALYAPVPPFAGKGWRHLSTVQHYLAHYDKSSQFTKFTDCVLG